MADARIILQTQGQEDQNIVQNAEFTFFKKDFRTHTQLGLDWQSINYNEKNEEGVIRDGQTITIRIPLNGDLLNEIYLRFKVVTDERWYVGTGSDLSECMFSPMTVFDIVDKVELMYNDHRLSELTSDYILCYMDLYKSIGEKNALANMVSYDNATREFINLDVSSVAPHTYLYMPLPFWFHKSPIHAIPLWALKDTNLTLKITLKDFSGPNQSRKIHDVDTMVQYAFVTEEEKEQFKVLPAEYTIKQVERIDRFEMNPNHKHRVDISPTNFIEYLLWNVQLYEEGTSGGVGYRQMIDGVKQVEIMMNGNTVIEADGDYFNWVQRFQHFNCDSTMQLYDPQVTNYPMFIPSRNANVDSPMPIYTYSFALDPRVPKESGFVSTVKFNHTAMTIESNDLPDVTSGFRAICSVYVVRHNILRIKDGYISMLYN
jgi:hypothetical protein